MKLPLVLSLTVLAAACGQSSEHSSSRAGTVRPIGAGDATATDPLAMQPPPPDDPARLAELSALIGSSPCTGGGPALPPFGRRLVDVDSRAYWQSSGLYLRRGERAVVTASGEWTIWKGQTAPFGPEGNAQLSDADGCRKGSLVARLGLEEGTRKHCIGAGASLVAEADGIVYLSMNDAASPAYHDGTVTVMLASGGDPVPDVKAADADKYDFCRVASGWVELHGAVVTVTAPAALAATEAGGLGASLGRLDALYFAESELAGGETPYEGQMLRLYPDLDMGTPGGQAQGWMVSGDPLLIDPRNLTAIEPSKMHLLRTDMPGDNLFELARALGVAYSRIHGGRFQADDSAAQAWGGLFALYATEKLKLGSPQAPLCQGKDQQVASGTAQTFASDPALQLCLLATLKEQFGWAVFTKFFQGLPTGGGWDAELPADAGPAATWAWLKGRLGQAAGADLTPVFQQFKLP